MACQRAHKKIEVYMRKSMALEQYKWDYKEIANRMLEGRLLKLLS